jgi:hypothetical protein
MLGYYAVRSGRFDLRLWASPLGVQCGLPPVLRFAAHNFGVGYGKHATKQGLESIELG